MGLMMMWGFIILLMLAVIFLFWFQFKNVEVKTQDVEVLQLEEKVLHLELHLKKSLEIMQDLAKKMHVQQEVLDLFSDMGMILLFLFNFKLLKFIIILRM